MKKLLNPETLWTRPLQATGIRRLFRVNILAGVFFVFAQIILGGMVASTYSGLVCIDFPTCNGQFFPPMVGPIGIQMLHRFGAYWVTLLMISLFFIATFKARQMDLSMTARKQAVMIFCLVFAQVFVGVMNLKYLMPAFLSVLHLALALALLLSLVKLYFQTQPREGNIP